MFSPYKPNTHLSFDKSILGLPPTVVRVYQRDQVAPVSGATGLYLFLRRFQNTSRFMDCWCCDLDPSKGLFG
jgi:hypothetical protein